MVLHLKHRGWYRRVYARYDRYVRVGYEVESDDGVKQSGIKKSNQAKRAIRRWSECGIVTRLLLTSDRLLVLKHPLLLSIIKIIESGLEELLNQAANAVRSAGRKSDWLLLAHSVAPPHLSPINYLHPFLHL